MARRRFPQRPGDHVLGEQLFQQALPVQFRQPLRPEPRPGRDPGGHLRGPGILLPGGAGGVDAGVMTMANLAGNKAPGERKGVDNPVPTRSFVLFQGPPHPVTPPRSTCSQTVTITPLTAR